MTQNKKGASRLSLGSAHTSHRYVGAALISNPDSRRHALPADLITGKVADHATEAVCGREIESLITDDQHVVRWQYSDYAGSERKWAACTLCAHALNAAEQISDVPKFPEKQTQAVGTEGRSKGAPERDADRTRSLENVLSAVVPNLAPICEMDKSGIMVPTDRYAVTGTKSGHYAVRINDGLPGDVSRMLTLCGRVYPSKHMHLIEKGSRCSACASRLKNHRVQPLLREGAPVGTAYVGAFGRERREQLFDPESPNQVIQETDESRTASTPYWDGAALSDESRAKLRPEHRSRHDINTARTPADRAGMSKSQRRRSARARSRILERNRDAAKARKAERELRKQGINPVSSALREWSTQATGHQAWQATREGQ